ncbi:MULTISPECIES: hypothetical protein [Acetobacter]|jgi:cytoskeletal protein CcmA (bactofilin family)|uniref:Cytoskeletal protein CcmA (Bactofilin family) n=1 Tax=Acetobacter lovaniensis TaxID=104100 RepID=A0A841QE01_9PROT|nr:hypothetical protein [Acetobacter lovaniensis]MBB6457129.1 cytoskeletal protein CcmA (bactofilin family) [Acetobacter lovaniensis]MCI1697711.1 hypothetical protein [Acetobacter lovaniensis]MCI1795120.1 hypothetical protein [Acetobacter lovaniensis]MCP1239528.1 hypothetical protein [Acetobacter lovaniensis]NHN81289.1 hypothetical protein [Acetobacter lovaniensis]
MNNGDNAFGTLAEPTQTILVQGLNVASLKCETDAPIAIGGTVRSAHLQAPIVDVLESGMVSGELVAEEVVIRGTAENVVVRAKRFFATGTAKIQNCTLFLEGVSGCSIQQGAELTGDFKITTAALAAAPVAPVAPVTPAVSPASFAASTSAPTPVKAVKVEVKPAPVVATSSKSATTESSKSTSSGADNGSVWGDMDQVMRSTAETEDGHASLMGMSDTQP